MRRASVSVRPALSADLPGVAELVRAVDGRDGPPEAVCATDPQVEDVRASLEKVLVAGSRALLVAIDEVTGAPAGLLIAQSDEIGTIDLTPVLHVSHLIVAPGFRRRGVGRALLAGAVQMADARGVDRVVATVAAGSREGNRYLARLGFAPLVTQRVASTGVLRRALGLADTPARVAVLRRTRLARSRRGPVRPLTRGV